jgi:hypothetical protein
MIWNSGWKLASAVSNAGGLGIIGFDIQENQQSRQLGNASDRISDGLSIYFLQSGFNLIERTKIAPLIKEMQLQKLGVLSQDDAVKLGKIANVKYVVYGSGNGDYTGGDPFIDTITVKMTDVESGTMVMVINWKGSGVQLGGVIDDIGNKIVEEFKKR